MTTPATTFEAHGHIWTKHEPGDPMPCDGDALIYTIMHGKRSTYSSCSPASTWRWGKIDQNDIIGWRFATPPQEKDELTRLREENASMRKVIKSVLSFLEFRFGNDTGDDWSDNSAGSLADELLPFTESK